MSRTIIAATLVAGLMTIGSARALETGSAAPDFTLKDTSGTEHTLSSFKGKYVVLEWVNYGCPFVKKFYSNGDMQALQKEWTGKDIVWLSICSSAPGKQGYMTTEEAVETNKEKDASGTAYLIDDDGTVGKLYGAKTTPHMYVVDPEGTLIYQGAIDSVRSTNSADIPGAENYVVNALNAAMAGEAVDPASTQPYGCSVKYGK